MFTLPRWVGVEGGYHRCQGYGPTELVGGWFRSRGSERMDVRQRCEHLRLEFGLV